MIRIPTKRDIFNNLSSIPGWSTSRKLLVFESDDWGSIRMPSTSVYNSLVSEGIDLSSDEGFRYNKNDSLETGEDLSCLFEVLSSVCDSTSRPMVITPISIVANPDFEGIRNGGFQEYFYEPFNETFRKIPGCENSFSFWEEGIKKRLFVPQFHGREHLNVKVWMRSLQRRNELALKAFNHGVWGISTSKDPEVRLEFQAAFDYIDPEDLNYHREVLISGLNLFETLFGYRATYFVPPNGPFSSKLEQTCYDNGIRHISVPKKHIEPLGNFESITRYHWLGQRNKTGIRYLVRNCFFEPGQTGRDWVDTCLRDISTAFRWHKPAIISSHRVNFIGALYKSNRDTGLRQLKLLLENVIKNWPEVEFITTGELGNIMNNDI